MLEKTLDSTQLTDEQMEKINRFTRRKLGREEVFAFSLILCDNEIDRDYERFPKQSLEVLSGLFVGKTGVFDHSPKAKNQSARIFDTALEETGERNALDRPYCVLRAYAYMLRSPKNQELIFEIDGGIKKEVSVGCAVDRVVCSVCGANQKAGGCAHKKGEVYGGQVCHYRLEDPTDAYEWSFVAVPAQKGAGVTKRMTSRESRYPDDFGTVTLQKAQYAALSEKASAGEAYLAGLRGEVVRLAGFALPGLPPALAGALAKKLGPGQLTELRGCLRKAAGKALPPSPQLGGGDPPEAGANSPFVI